MTLEKAIDWNKVGGLVPAVVQDAVSGQVLMLGYMNKEALEITEVTKQVTFYSRTKQRLWTKGETSGNTLALKSISLDCDQDALLVKATPHGPVCHLGSQTCFADDPGFSLKYLAALESTISERKSCDPEASYTAKLFARGRDKIAQKVGEEAVEVVIASKNESDPDFLGECADLVYHLTVLLSDRNLGWSEVLKVLESRDRKPRRSDIQSNSST